MLKRRLAHLNWGLLDAHCPWGLGSALQRIYLGLPNKLTLRGLEFKRLLCSALTLVVIHSVSAAQGKVNVSQTLHALFDEEWQAELADDPLWASALGNLTWNTQWPDEGPQAAARRQVRRSEALKKLKAIDQSELPALDKINYDLFQERYLTAMDEERFRYHLFPFTQAATILRQGELAGSLRFESAKDFEDWIERMRRFPAYLKEVIAVMQEGKSRGVLPSRSIMQGLLSDLKHELATDALRGQFYAPFQNMPATISSDDRARLRREANEVIARDVIPAYIGFKTFLGNEYLPACSNEVGIGSMPQGHELYSFLVRKFTTTNLSPQEIHDIGLNEVKRIRFEMEAVKTKVGFHGTLRQFFRHLQSDTRFHYDNSDALLSAYRATAKRIDPELVRLFHVLPRVPYGIAPMSADLATNASAAFYRQGAANGSRPGMLFVNLSRPKQRLSFEVLVVCLHEGVPGHHLQMSLQQELGEMPSFRRFSSYIAFAEGWALYAESLGEDIDLYADPYDKLGRLNYEMLRAVRLVLDTGLHEFGWTRARALAYFVENTGKPLKDAVVEVDRYIGSPGQALAYKIGELKIQQLRSRASKQLGASFDLRSFNDTVLSIGSVPLDILEKHVDAWIEDQRTKYRR